MTSKLSNTDRPTTIKNAVQLCTYADRLGCGDLNSLEHLLSNQFKNLFGTVHILPFYYPIDGADAGFDPIDHTQVDSRLGDWSDVKTISKSHDIMADMIVNHVSSESEAFQDFLAKGENSKFCELFLRLKDVFPTGATEEQLLALYRPRPGLPFTKLQHKNGDESILWTTFTSNQIDINVYSEQGSQYLTRIFDTFKQSAIKMIRLDAAGYAVKKAGTNCFMTPDTFNFIDELTSEAKRRDMEVLVEIHSHYLTQIEIAKYANWVYDFALPPLVLHALECADSKPLQKWLSMSPRNCISVLDTHDGIGIIDVASEKGTSNGLLDDNQISDLVESIHTNSGQTSKKATGAAASNVDLYQVNCTYFEALGRDENKYLVSRLIQFFAPGIPQVYYVGLLAGLNDMDLLARTQVGRDINREYFTTDKINAEIRKPVVQHLFSLIHLRNNHQAFQDGEFSCNSTGADTLEITWIAPTCSIGVSINLSTLSFKIVSTNDGKQTTASNWDDIKTI